MIPDPRFFYVAPGSRAPILAATHIVDLAIRRVHAHPWGPDSGRFERRVVDLEVELQGTWKGDVEADLGDRCAIRVAQYRPAGPRFIAVPGPWSRIPLEEHPAVTVFSTPCAEALGDLLVAKAVRTVELTGAVAPSLHVLSGMGTPPMPLRLLLRRVAATPERVGRHAAWVLVARFTELSLSTTLEVDAVPTLMGGVADVDAALALIARDALEGPSRWVLLTELVTMLLLRDPAPDPVVGRVVHATLELLVEPKGQPLRPAMLQTYLPNLLGLVGGSVPKHADLVFATDPSARRASIAAAGAMGAEPGAAELLAWLR